MVAVEGELQELEVVGGPGEWSSAYLLCGPSNHQVHTISVQASLPVYLGSSSAERLSVREAAASFPRTVSDWEREECCMANLQKI